MISFQLEQAQGNFPAVFTYSLRADFPVHMCGAEQGSSSGTPSVAETLAALSLPLPGSPFHEIGERGETFSLPLAWMYCSGV